MGLLDGVANGLTQSSVDSALRRQGGGSFPALPAPPRYSFEIWDDVGPVGSDVLRGMVKQIVAFRLAPNSISFSQPVRSDVAMDLQGNPVVVDGGLGLGQCTIRGTYGVGGTLDPAYSSPGFANMREVRDFFVGWADLNKARALEGIQPLRLIFSIRNGRWSEWRFLQWWVVPTALPTEERSAGRPHEWSYSCSFWCLDVLFARANDVLPGPTSTDAASKNLTVLQSALAVYRDVTDGARDLANQMATLQAGVETLRAAAISEVRGLGDTIQRASLAVAGILAATDPLIFRDEVRETYRTTLISTRKALGRMKAWGTTMAGSVPGAARVAPTVTPGGTIQQVAALAGSLASWPSLASKNGLRYPFVNGTVTPTMAATAVDPGRVLTVGDEVSVSAAVPGVGPADLVGSDLAPSGSPGSLVGGVQNLQLALLRRVGCPRGYLPHHQDYGSLIYTYLGGTLDLASVLALRDEVGRTLLSDSRVQAIRTLSVDVDGDSVSISAVLDTVLGAVDLSGQVGRVEA